MAKDKAKIKPKSTRPKNADNGKLTQFTKEYQPSPQAKSEGTKRWWDRRKLKEDMFKALAEPLLTSEGQSIDTFDEGIKLLKKALFAKDTPINKRAELFLKITDLIGIKESDLTLSNPDGSPISININFVDAKNTNNPKR